MVLGGLDGFNICSLGALILILGLVLALKSKKKILIFGGLFITTTMIVYTGLILLWHRLFIFISPHIKKMEIFIGLLALGGAIYFLNSTYKSIKNKNICKFGGISEKIMRKVQKIFESKANIFVLVGAILLFAAVVTIIEFPCTAFFPALFTGILAKTQTPFNLSLFYIAIYAFFYMLDEVAIFLIALFTMKIWIASPKIIAFINSIATLLLFLISFYYLFGLL